MKKMLFFVLLLFAGCSSKGLPFEPSKNENKWRPNEIWFQGPIIGIKGFGMGDDEYLAESQRQDFFKHMKSIGCDVLELRIWYDDPELTIRVIKEMHAAGIKVALNFWQYPGMWDAAAMIPAEYLSMILEDDGTRVGGYVSDGGAGVFRLDLTNPTAINWMMKNLDNWLAEINSKEQIDYFFIVEDKLNPWNNPYEWPKQVDYWKAPVYSDYALKAWREYAGDSRAKFPVHDASLINDSNENMLTLVQSNRDSLWLKHFRWRAEIFTNYLGKLSRIGEKNSKFGTVLMEWHRLIDECYFNNSQNSWPAHLLTFIEDNYIFGVNYELIAKNCPAVKTLVVEYGEDGTHPEWTIDDNGRNAVQVASICRSNGKKLGTFLQLFGYDSGLGGIKPEVVRELWEKNNLPFAPDMVVVYDCAVVYPKSTRHNQATANAWREIVNNK